MYICDVWIHCLDGCGHPLPFHVLIPQADLRCQAFTDVNVNLVGAAAETLMMGGPAAPLPTKPAGTQAGSMAPLQPPAPSSSGDAPVPTVDWDESQQLALVEALKR